MIIILEDAIPESKIDDLYDFSLKMEPEFAPALVSDSAGRFDAKGSVDKNYRKCPPSAPLRHN
jgi:hypothetical protein